MGNNIATMYVHDLEAGTLIGKIPKSADDAEFRRVVKGLLDNAKHELIVIAGELGSYKFPELRESAIAARKRGASVKVYASMAPPEVVDELRAYGAEVVVGSHRVKNHFMMVDGTVYAVSFKSAFGPTEVGTRSGLYGSGSSVAQAIRRLFCELDFLDTVDRSKRDKSVFVRVFANILGLFVKGLTTTGAEPRIG